MKSTIVGIDNVQPYKFSECSEAEYIKEMQLGHAICLLNKPNQVNTQVLPECKFYAIESRTL